MPRRMIFNPADGTYIYADDEDPSATPLAGMPSQDVIGRTIGAPPVAGSGIATDPQVAPTPQGLDQFGDYDPTYEAMRANTTATRNQAEEDYASQLQRLTSAFEPQFAMAQDRHAQDLDMFGNKMANQGMLYSSNNLQGQGRINTDYANMLGAMTQQRQQGQEALAQQRLGALRGADQQMTTAQGQHATFLAQQASQRAARDAAIQAAQQQSQQLLGVTPTGQLTPPTGMGGQGPSIQYATPDNPVGLTGPGSTVGQAPGPSPLPVSQDNGASLAAQMAAQQGPTPQDPYSSLWAQQQGAPATQGASVGEQPFNYTDDQIMSLAGSDPSLLPAILRRLGLQ